MFNILQKGSTSQVLVLDPIGTVPLMHAEKKARQGRTLLVRGLCRQLLKTIDACRAPQKAIQLTSFLFHDQTTGNCPPMASFEADLPAVFKSLPAVCVRNKDMT